MARSEGSPVVEVRVVREAPLARIASPRDVRDYLVNEMGAQEWPQERFVVLILDTQNNVRAAETVTVGILDASLAHPREVFALAVVERAASIVLAHNHPSGDPTPSAADREDTRQLVKAGRILGIPVRDHVIVGDGARYVSMLDAGLVDAT